MPYRNYKLPTHGEVVSWQEFFGTLVASVYNESDAAAFKVISKNTSCEIEVCRAAAATLRRPRALRDATAQAGQRLETSSPSFRRRHPTYGRPRRAKPAHCQGSGDREA